MSHEAAFEWCVSTRSLDGQPFSVSAPAIPESARGNRPYLAVARILYAPGPNGLPIGSEYKNAIRREDLVVAELIHEGGIHVGHRLGAGELVVAVYCTSQPPEIVSIKPALFRTEKVHLEVGEDADWHWYVEHLQPTPVEYEANKFRNLMARLKEAGDDPACERPIDFTFAFTSDEGRTDFLTSIAAQGYKLNEEGAWKSETGPKCYWCSVDAIASLEGSAIYERCAYLRSEASKFDGEFDGWACHVTTASG